MIVLSFKWPYLKIEQADPLFLFSLLRIKWAILPENHIRFYHSVFELWPNRKHPKYLWLACKSMVLRRLHFLTCWMPENGQDNSLFSNRKCVQDTNRKNYRQHLLKSTRGVDSVAIVLYIPCSTHFVAAKKAKSEQDDSQEDRAQPTSSTRRPTASSTSTASASSTSAVSASSTHALPPGISINLNLNLYQLRLLFKGLCDWQFPRTVCLQCYLPKYCQNLHL